MCHLFFCALLSISLYTKPYTIYIRLYPKLNTVIRNHPKSTVLFKFFALSYFAGKKSHV